VTTADCSDLLSGFSRPKVSSANTSSASKVKANSKPWARRRAGTRKTSDSDDPRLGD
jgi:hypothetical protein